MYTRFMKKEYGIIIELDNEMLKNLYVGDSFEKAYSDIRAFFEERNFKYISSSFYYGEATPVEAILFCKELSKKFDWFYPAVKTIELIRISERNDLMPIIER